MSNVLICGSRGKYNIYFVRAKIMENIKPKDMLIHGGCKGSPDMEAEIFNTKDNNVVAFKAAKGGYLQRNIKMVEECDKVIAFWNGYSYGTAHTIAQAVLLNKPISIYSI